MLTARLGADIATPISVSEDAANGTVVATAFAAERQADVVTYSLANSAGGRFGIDASTGVVTVANGSLLNNNSGTSQSITIRATDSAGQTYDEAFTIQVAIVNDAPVLADTALEADGGRGCRRAGRSGGHAGHRVHRGHHRRGQ